MLLKLIYGANVLVAGWIAFTSLYSPRVAAATVFGNAYAPTEVMRLVGCLWFAIAILSLLGLFRPVTFAPVLLVQLVYKSTWLVVVALPALRSGAPYPVAMAGFFLVWVLVLPFAIPWQQWWVGR